MPANTLNERLAELIEARPTEPPEIPAEAWSDDFYPEATVKSPGGCWEYYTEDRKWTCDFNPLNNHADAVRLVEWYVAEHGKIEITGFVRRGPWRVWARTSYARGEFRYAVTHAIAKALGVEIESEGE